MGVSHTTRFRFSMNERIWSACRFEVQWICMPMDLLNSPGQSFLRRRVDAVQAVRRLLFPNAK